MVFLLPRKVGYDTLCKNKSMIGVQIIVNGIIAGSIYALIASGFSLIYSSNRFVHFAHGSMAAVGAYLTYAFFHLWGVPFLLAALLAIICTTLIGLLLYSITYRLLQKKKSATFVLLMAGIGLMIFLDNLLLLLFGAKVKSIDVIETAKGISVLGAIITPLQVAIVVLSLVILGLLGVFMRYTKQGKILRAVADNDDLARISGINTTKVQYLGFGIGSAMAGIAGILIGIEQNLEPAMGMQLIIKGFTGAVIGGVTSIPGSVLGSYLLGLVENIGIWFLPSGYKDAIAFTLLLLFLILRPQGILGIRKEIRQ